MLVKGPLIVNTVWVGMGRATEVRTFTIRTTSIGPAALDTREGARRRWLIWKMEPYLSLWHGKPVRAIAFLLHRKHIFVHENNISPYILSLRLLSLIESRLSMQNMTAIDTQTRIPCMHGRSKSLKISSRGLWTVYITFWRHWEWQMTLSTHWGLDLGQHCFN